MTRALVIALLLTAPALSAQQQPLVGTWQLSFVVGARNENGITTPIKGSGVLTVEAQGDSLIGTLATDPVPGMPPRPSSRMAAKSGPGEVVFVSHTKATISRNGDAQETTAISTWRLSAMNDTLSGSVERSIEGMEAANRGPEPVTGTRKKG